MAQSRTQSVLVTAAAVVVVIAGMKAAAGIIGPVVLAAALTIVFHPLLRRLDARMPTWAASVIVLVAVYLMILALAVALVISVGRLAGLLPQYADEVDAWLSSSGDWLGSAGVGADQVRSVLQALDVGRLIGFVGSLLGGILGVVSDLAFLVTVLFFLVFDAAHSRHFAAVIGRRSPAALEAIKTYAHGTSSYLWVSAVFGFAVAVVDTIALWLLGVPGAFVWGVLAFVTNFIPNIGFVIGIVPPALVGLLEGGPGLLLAVLVLYSLINFVIQSLVQPRIVGNVVGLSPTLTFLSLVFWAWVLGALGALLAVPMTLLAKAVLVDAHPPARWVNGLLRGRSSEPDE